MGETDGAGGAEFVGNWWVAGNPYKSLHLVLLHHEQHVKSELQLHTSQSLEQAQANRPDYELFRDRQQPLALRQAAYDRMVERFAAVPHPPGVEGIGEPIAVPRPVAETPPRDHHAEALSHMRALAERVAAAHGISGIRVEPIVPSYPPLLRFLLDRGRDRLGSGHFRTALEDFDQLISEFDGDEEHWDEARRRERDRQRGRRTDSSVAATRRSSAGTA